MFVQLLNEFMPHLLSLFQCGKDHEWSVQILKIGVQKVKMYTCRGAIGVGGSTFSEKILSVA